MALTYINSLARVRSSFFAQYVINVWNSLPFSVDFSTLSAFKRSLQRVNLNEFLTVYKSVDVYDYVQWILFVFCFSLLSVFHSVAFRSIAYSLTRSDISAGNSLFVPQ